MMDKRGITVLSHGEGFGHTVVIGVVFGNQVTDPNRTEAVVGTIGKVKGGTGLQIDRLQALIDRIGECLSRAAWIGDTFDTVVIGAVVDGRGAPSFAAGNGDQASVAVIGEESGFQLPARFGVCVAQRLSRPSSAAGCAIIWVSSSPV